MTDATGADLPGAPRADHRTLERAIRLLSAALLALAVVLLLAWAWTEIRVQQHGRVILAAGAILRGSQPKLSVPDRVDLFVANIGSLYPPALLSAVALAFRITASRLWGGPEAS